jgi:hypothetical protein
MGGTAGDTCHGRKRASGGAQVHRRVNACGGARKRAIGGGSGLHLGSAFSEAGCNRTNIRSVSQACQSATSPGFPSRDFYDEAI